MSTMILNDGSVEIGDYCDWRKGGAVCYVGVRVSGKMGAGTIVLL